MSWCGAGSCSLGNRIHHPRVIAPVEKVVIICSVAEMQGFGNRTVLTITAMCSGKAMSAIGLHHRDAARREGFTHVELMGTLAGEPLYRAYGYEIVEEVADDRGGAPVPLVRMSKVL